MSWFLKRPKYGVKGEFFIKLRFVNGQSIPVHGPCEEPDCHTFGPHYSLTELAKLVFDFMVQNKIPGADREAIWTMINLYTCVRLGNDPKYCKDGSRGRGVQASVAAAIPRSKCCGAKL